MVQPRIMQNKDSRPLVLSKATVPGRFTEEVEGGFQRVIYGLLYCYEVSLFQFCFATLCACYRVMPLQNGGYFFLRKILFTSFLPLPF